MTKIDGLLLKTKYVEGEELLSAGMTYPGLWMAGGTLASCQGQVLRAQRCCAPDLRLREHLTQEEWLVRMGQGNPFSVLVPQVDLRVREPFSSWERLRAPACVRHVCRLPGGRA